MVVRLSALRTGRLYLQKMLLVLISVRNFKWYPSIFLYRKTGDIKTIYIVRVALLRSSWRSCFMRAALFVLRATNLSLVFTFSWRTSLFIHPHKQKSDLYASKSNSCISRPIENWTHVSMNLFTRNSPYYYFLKYLLFKF